MSRARRRRTAPAAVAREQRVELQLAHHLGGVAVGHRRDPHRDVLEQLGVGAAGPAGDHRPEARVLRPADEQLDAAGDHRLHKEARRARSRPPSPSARIAVAARATSAGVREGGATAPASLLCRRPRATAFSATGQPSSRPAPGRGVAAHDARRGQRQRRSTSSSSYDRLRRHPAPRRAASAAPMIAAPSATASGVGGQRDAGRAARARRRSGRRARARAPRPPGNWNPGTDTPSSDSSAGGPSAVMNTAAIGIRRVRGGGLADRPRDVGGVGDERRDEDRQDRVARAGLGDACERAPSSRRRRRSRSCRSGWPPTRAAGRSAASRRCAPRRAARGRRARGLAGVGAEDPRAAGVGDDRHAVAARQRLRGRAAPRRRTARRACRCGSRRPARTARRR